MVNQIHGSSSEEDVSKCRNHSENNVGGGVPIALRRVHQHAEVNLKGMH